MKSVRLAAAFVLAATLLLLGVTRPKAVASAFEPLQTSCSAPTLARDLSQLGEGQVVRVTSFGCDGPWSFLWADVENAGHTIGVTVVLRWRPDLNAWWPTDRTVTCVAGVLPEAIYRQGCFSN